MGKLTASQIYADARAAGFNPAQATIMTAIALAESAGSDTATGDVSLENNTWGPSYGLWQVRTLKAQTGTGAVRDINWLAGSDVNQATAAFSISHQGNDFSPWTTYTRGTYLQFMGQARAAAAGDTGGSTPATLTGTGATSSVGGFRDLAVQAVFVILGLALVGTGLVVAFRPQLAAAGRTAAKAAVVL